MIVPEAAARYFPREDDESPGARGPQRGEPHVAIQSCGWSRSGPDAAGNQDSFLNSPEKFLWAVADGVSAGVHGDKASALAIKALACLGRPESLDAQLKEAVRLLSLVNGELWARREIAPAAKEFSPRLTNSESCTLNPRSGKFCATTFVLLMMHEGRAGCLWAGDSRCYLLRKQILYQCTRDHSLRQEHIDQGLLSAAEAERMIKGHIITNSLGAGKDLFYEQVFFDLCPGDRLLLCTDGLSGLLGTELLEDVLKRSQNPQEAAGRFTELAARREAKDDATQISIFLSGAREG